jgi:hypothetical protein
VDVQPIRRYSDGTENSSIMDVMVDVAVPAGETRTGWAMYDYNAQAHALIGCRARIVGQSEETPLDVSVAP